METPPGAGGPLWTRPSDPADNTGGRGAGVQRRHLHALLQRRGHRHLILDLEQRRLIPQRRHEGGQSGGRRDQGVAGELHPRRVGAPGGGVPGGQTPQASSRLLVLSACPLARGRYPDARLDEAPSAEQKALWTPVRHDVSWDPVDAEDVLDQQLPGLRRQRERLGKAVDHGQYDGVRLGVNRIGPVPRTTRLHHLEETPHLFHNSSRWNRNRY